MAEERLKEIRESRLNKRRALLEQNKDPYPAEARRTHTVAQVLEGFAELQADTTPIILAGRVMAARRHGGVMFFDLVDAYGQIQLQMTEQETGQDEFALAADIDRGDFVQVTGQAIMTERGKQTILVENWHWLAKSIRPLPDKWYGLKDAEKRYRRRELDLLLNEEARTPVIVKSELVDWLRKYLKGEGFLEVETPILQPQVGGATAKPFVTHHNSLGADLFLRVAPELYLKKLLVAGLEKVFELGKNFRNEGMDRDHNPEYTFCEFYWAYADYEDLMKFTEEMVSKLVQEMRGDTKIMVRDKEVDFVLPWKRVSFVNLFKEKYGVDVLEQKETAPYIQLLKEHNLEVPKVQTVGKLVDELYKELIRPALVQPTLLYDYPAELAPLAKGKAQDKRITEAIQLVVAGTEVVWAYSELNDPVEQKTRFEAQQRDRAQGDEEVGEVDEDYLEAMEYGMPPAAGWGMGVDRMAALLSGAASIRETAAFPLLRPEKKRS